MKVKRIEAEAPRGRGTTILPRKPLSLNFFIFMTF